MLQENKKITIEFCLKNEKNGQTNPIIYNTESTSDNIKEMVNNILDKELPMLKNNSLLHNLVLYTVTEKVKTVQTVENVLSYIKEKNVKGINDVRFKDGEVCIECSI